MLRLLFLVKNLAKLSFLVNNLYNYLFGLLNFWIAFGSQIREKVTEKITYKHTLNKLSFLGIKILTRKESDQLRHFSIDMRLIS